MAGRQTAPFGTWKSPITSDLIVAESIRLGEIALDGEDIYWLEGRPAEAGRNVLVRRTADGVVGDVTPPPFNVRTRVHEYGGGAYVVNDGTVYFSNFADQRLYRQAPGGKPEPLTAENGMRYADGDVDRKRQRLVLVREDHSVEGREAVNTVVSIGMDGSDERVLVSGTDFYSTPRLSPDGSQLTWVTWNHPNMPWDESQLWVAPVDAAGGLGTPTLVAGGKNESIFQPAWSPSGELHFVSDRTGWWNLYRRRNGQIEALYPMEAEFGLPLWVFDMVTYGFAAADRIICSYIVNGSQHLASLNTSTGELSGLETPYTSFDGLKVNNTKAVFEGGSSTAPRAIVKLDLGTGQCEVLRRSSTIALDPAYISVAEHIEFPTERGLTAHGYFYRPTNAEYVAPAGEKPPLLVNIHGGPTGATSSAFDTTVQYWTSRGFAILDVDYGGSTGYGTEYRRRLNGQWGIIDVEDCVNGATYLVEQGLVDGNRLTINGGSAGGYTTLCALTFRDTFKAGASYYGVSDVEALATDTHKFESRYLDSMIGPYPARRDLYVERSPIHHTDQLARPLIIFQGLEDKVVPPSQAELMFEAVKAKGIPVAYLPFEGEQHGFRMAKNIKRSLDAEFYFYAKVFGYTPADAIEPVDIVNLP
ncbi:MAG: dipeptidyl aminopeptidase/acylaminoacyl peptidase [Chloroflexi bacterium]|nr:dipeptidyl aminopeptidase/acylaminoacyl peptidase [Chloroflexota bacterium]